MSLAHGSIVPCRPSASPFADKLMDVVYRIPAVLLPGWGDKDVWLEAANHQPAQLLSAMCFDAERHLSTGRFSRGQGGVYLGAHKTAQCQAILKSLGTPFLPPSSGSGASTLEGVAKAFIFFFKTKGKVLPASRKTQLWLTANAGQEMCLPFFLSF